jgi:prenyltransferase beta subunit
MRREAAFFGEQELDLLYMAAKLRQALKLEDLLTESNIDYLVETGSYTGGFLFKRELTGAFFYVAPADLERSRELLAAHQFKPFTAEQAS